MRVYLFVRECGELLGGPLGYLRNSAHCFLQQDFYVLCAVRHVVNRSRWAQVKRQRMFVRVFPCGD